jgi:hypothetical protein
MQLTHYRVKWGISIDAAEEVFWLGVDAAQRMPLPSWERGRHEIMADLVEARKRIFDYEHYSEVTDDMLIAYCEAWSRSFQGDNRFDTLTPLDDELKKHIRAGLEAAFVKRSDAIRSLQSKDGKDGAGDAEDARRFTEDQIVTVARALADRSADACNVNREDNWKIYGNDFIEDARAAIAAIEGKEKP